RLEVARNLLVRAFRRCGAVPGTAFGASGVLRLREHAVDALALGKRRTLVDRRPHEWMAELEPAVDHDHETFALGGLQRLALHAVRRRGPKDRSELTAVLCRRDDEQSLRLVRQAPHPRQIRTLWTPADLHWVVHALALA